MPGRLEAPFRMVYQGLLENRYPLTAGARKLTYRNNGLRSQRQGNFTHYQCARAPLKLYMKPMVSPLGSEYPCSRYSQNWYS